MRDSWWRRCFDGGVRLLRAGALLAFDSIALAGGKRKMVRSQGAIFCLHGWGDLMLAGRAIERLAADLSSRDLRAVLFVHPSLVGFARKHFRVAHVEGIDRHRFTRQLGYRAAVLRSIAGRFAVAVQPTFNRMLRVEDCLVRATRAAERIGSAGHAPFITPPEQRLGNRFYTKLVTPAPALMHELERYAEFTGGLGLTIPAEPWRPKAGAGAGRGSVPARPYLLLSPHASDTRRSWPLENFLRAARQIASQHNLTVVLVGTKKPQGTIRWPEKDGDAPEVIDLRGETMPEDLPDLAAGADLVVSNDSAVYHLAVSLDRPVLVVGGSGLPARYFPYPGQSSAKVLFQPVPCAGCNWRCIHTASRSETAWCLTQISWRQAAEAGAELLQRNLKHAAV